MTPTIDLEREPWHGTPAGYKDRRCPCNDCRAAKRIAKSRYNVNELRRKEGPLRLTRYGLEKPFSPNVHPEYKSAERDPRIAPRTGDVFEKAGRIREITNVSILPSGIYVYGIKDSGDYAPSRTEIAHVGRTDQLPLPNFRKWARDAKVLKVAK